MKKDCIKCGAWILVPHLAASEDELCTQCSDAPQEGEHTLSAWINAVGVGCSVPDNPGAVDATVYLDGEEIGEVTLLPLIGPPGPPHRLGFHRAIHR